MTPGRVNLPLESGRHARPERESSASTAAPGKSTVPVIAASRGALPRALARLISALLTMRSSLWRQRADHGKAVRSNIVVTRPNARRLIKEARRRVDIRVSYISQGERLTTAALDCVRMPRGGAALELPLSKQRKAAKPGTDSLR